MSEMLSSKIRPDINNEMIKSIVTKLYGFKVKSIKELNSYDDKNYLILCEKEHSNPNISDINYDGYVLKVLNSYDSKNEINIDGQNQMMIYLNENGINCSVPIKNLSNQYYSVEKLRDSDTTVHIVRMLIYCPGEIFYNGVSIAPELLVDIGKFIYKLDKTLEGFKHKAYENVTSHTWSLLSVPKLRKYLHVITNNNDKTMVADIIDNFEHLVLKNINKLKPGIIHGDLNEQNIIVDFKNNKILSIIDFGDAQNSYLIFELAINLCYMIIQTKDIKSVKYIIQGYETNEKLNKFEKSILKLTVCARIVQSLVLGLYSFFNEPDNNYLIVTQSAGWKMLKQLWNETNNEIWDL